MFIDTLLFKNISSFFFSFSFLLINMQNPPPPAPRIFPPIAPFDKQLSNKLSILLLDTFEENFF